MNGPLGKNEAAKLLGFKVYMQGNTQNTAIQQKLVLSKMLEIVSVPGRPS